MAYALPIAMIAMAAAGTAVAYMGQEAQKKQALAAGDYNNKVAEVNAKTAQQQAAVAAQQQRDNYMRVKSSQQAAFGKSGVTLDGSAADVMTDTVLSGETNALMETYKGSVAANHYRQGGTLALMESSAAANSAKYAQTGTLLTGASKAMGAASNTNWGGGGEAPPPSIRAYAANPEMESY